ncbi:MAG TPA: FecR domain-containing protein [Gemmatimonadaceae bacterium]
MSVATVAASGLLAAGGAFVMARARTSHHAATSVWHLVATAAGERKSARLSDGSVIELGPASTIRWTESDERRDVELTGLADFRVAHDSIRPFTVHARDAQVTDIGTEFVVRAYASDSATRVSVLSGTIDLARRTRRANQDTAARAASITLRAGDVGILGPSRVVRLAGAASLVGDSAWLRGALRFDDVRLDDVAIELGRWFGASISIDDPGLSRRRVTAIYAHPELPSVVGAIAATVGAAVVRDGQSYHLRMRGR